MTTDLEHGAPGNPSDAALKTPGHEQTDVGVFTDSKEPRGDGRAQKAYEKLQKLLSMGKVELNGVEPVPRHERTSKRYWNIFTVWCSINSNILGVLFGLLGPQIYGLSLRDSSLVILFFCLLSTIFPAYLATLGPKTGMRQMIQARYSFGRYLVTVPVLLNLATLTGFIVIICVIGGQCLAAVSDDGVNADVGIVIIALLGLIVSFAGFKVLHYYETYAFIPAIIAIAIAAGCGGHELRNQAVPETPATAPPIVTFGMIVASYMIPWAAIASDLTTYFDPDVPSSHVFMYTYAGLAIPTILLMTLGAAIAGAIPNAPAWQAGYDKNLVGGILAAMLEPAGGFGKFVVVVLSLTLLGNTAGTMYAITLNFQTLVPWLVRVPRYVFALVITAIVIPVAVRAVAQDFFVSLENFVALIGYWSASFVGIVGAEHLAFRRRRRVPGDPDGGYNHAVWADAGKLPWGVAALASGVLCFGMVVPCMEQVWWTGPIAKTTGDLGFELAFVLSAMFYVPLRLLEQKFTGR